MLQCAQVYEISLLARSKMGTVSHCYEWPLARLQDAFKEPVSEWFLEFSQDPNMKQVVEPHSVQ